MTQAQIKCRNCQSTDYRTEQSGVHIKAICNRCNSYIQFLSQGGIDENTEMYFGKYKGYKLKDIPPDYLIWLLDNAKKLGGSLKKWLQDNRDRLQQQIHEAK